MNSLAQVAARVALDDQDYMTESRERNQLGMDLLLNGLRDLDIVAAPSLGNFVLADFRRPFASLHEQLLRAGVIVRPVANYGLPNHARITVGLPEELERFLHALTDIIGSGEGSR